MRTSVEGQTGTNGGRTIAGASRMQRHQARDVEVVHPVHIDEVDGWASTLATTFLDDTSPEDHARLVNALRQSWDAERRWGARAGERWVGTLGSWQNMLSVPGAYGVEAEVAADALTMVTVAGTHRRRGLLTAMLSDSLQAAKDRGDAVSILWAAEWPIYGRFGYAPATATAAYQFSPRVSGGAPAPAGGTITPAETADIAAQAPAVFAAARHLRAGNIDRPKRWWSHALGLDGYPPYSIDGKRPRAFIHAGPDGPDGFVTWLPTRPFDIDGTNAAIEVHDLCAANDSAYRDIWAYLASLDLVGEITLRRRPADEPIRWLLPNGRALRQTYAGDGLWLRMLDLPLALSARRYATPDRLILEVVDDDIGGFGAGRYVLDGGPDGATCTPSREGTADLRIHQRALAAAYLGGFSLHSQAIAGLVDELTPNALRRADAMFATPFAPWCATGF